MTKFSTKIKFILVLFFLLTNACAHFKQEKNQQSIKNANKVNNTSESAHLSKKQAIEIKQNQKDLKLVLERKKQIQGKDHSEGRLYSLLLKNYEKNDEVEFNKNLKTYLKKYGQHYRADEVLFMAGHLAANNKNYGSAIRYFNQVLRDYPYSNKTVSSLSGKAQTLKNMNLNDLAKDVYQSIVIRYPGSPEALNAQQQIKTIR
jgi:TolA-binding protein